MVIYLSAYVHFSIYAPHSWEIHTLMHKSLLSIRKNAENGTLYTYMKHHATVQTVRERYNSRREKILKKLLRISSRRLLYRLRTV